jgi:hypothetical protein
MAPRATFDLYDQMLGGKLAELLTELRTEHSFEEMAFLLRTEHQVSVTKETVRQWCKRLDEAA